MKRSLAFFAMLTLCIAPSWAQYEEPPPLTTPDGWPPPPNAPSTQRPSTMPPPVQDEFPSNPSSRPPSGQNQGQGLPPMNPPGFDAFDEPDSEPDSGYSGGSGSIGSGKSSFQFVEPFESENCRVWGHPLLAEARYASDGICDRELSRKIESALSASTETEESFAQLKLRMVIKRIFPDRQSVASMKLGFPKLEKDLRDARSKGCLCLTH